MGCNVGCPFIGRNFDDNWQLDDLTGKSDEEFKTIIKRIEQNIIKFWINNITAIKSIKPEISEQIFNYAKGGLHYG